MRAVKKRKPGTVVASRAEYAKNQDARSGLSRRAPRCTHPTMPRPTIVNAIVDRQQCRGAGRGDDVVRSDGARLLRRLATQGVRRLAFRIGNIVGEYLCVVVHMSARADCAVSKSACNVVMALFPRRVTQRRARATLPCQPSIESDRNHLVQPASDDSSQALSVIPAAPTIETTFPGC